jgi:DNA-binding IclR family transcriptional regulator
MGKTEHAPPASGVQVISRAAEIMRTLRSASDGITQSQLVGRLGLARSTVHRLLNALEAEGLVESSESRGGRYRIGPLVLQIAENAWKGLLVQIHPLLEELSREVFETVDLSVLDRNRATFVDQVAAPNRLQAVSAVGKSFPLHCTANGKAFLAALPDRERAAALPVELPAYTPNTITDPVELDLELLRVREEGVAYDREEHTEGVCAVSTLVRRPQALPLAVSIPLPAQRFLGREHILRDALLGWAARVEEQLAERG